MVELGNYRINIYHSLRKISAEEARRLVRKVYEKNGKKVKRVAKILGVSKNTVKRAIKGPLSDLSRRPKSIKNMIDKEIEELILKEQKRTNFGYRQLRGYLRKKYKKKISEWTIKKVLYRNGRVRRRKRGLRKYKALYIYGKINPFEHIQVDTKYIFDKSSLPEFVYHSLEKAKVPLYQWTAIDVKTRIRFLAYSYNLYSFYGYMFLVFIVSWLRAHNVKGMIKIRIDQGSEFPGVSEKKLKETNLIFRRYLGSELEVYPKGQSQYNSIVENSHRKDDEEFLIPFSEVIKDKRDFIDKAQRWLLYWNTKRIHYAKGFRSQGETAIEHLKRKTDTLINTNLVYFPVFIMEDIFTHQTSSLSDVLPEKLLHFPSGHLNYKITSYFKRVNISVPSAKSIQYSFKIINFSFIFMHFEVLFKYAIVYKAKIKS